MNTNDLSHRVLLGDARDLSAIPNESVALVCTSPPYGALKGYGAAEGQLGNIDAFDDFCDELDRVWAECHRVLVPGGRVACVVGDVCLSRRQAGRHHVLPLAAEIQVRARRLGLDNLTPIRWHKITNIALEASRSSVFLGKPNLPNGVIKNDLEHLLLLRKPGGYRRPSLEQQQASRIETDDYRRWFQTIWSDIPGERARLHPAPFPVALAERLIRMFSFVGDTVLDPFAGSGTTAVAAHRAGRASISVEVQPEFVEIINQRLASEAAPQLF